VAVETDGNHVWRVPLAGLSNLAACHQVLQLFKPLLILMEVLASVYMQQQGLAAASGVPKGDLVLVVAPQVRLADQIRIEQPRTSSWKNLVWPSSSIPSKRSSPRRILSVASEPP